MNREKVLELARKAGFNWPEISTTTIEERLERFAALIEREVRGDAEPVKQEPIKFLANSTRFKLSFQDTEPDSVGNAGTCVTCFEGWERELDGRWVALVDAEDGRHLAYTHPTPAVVRQLVEALEQLMSIVKIYSRATSNNFAWAEMDFAKEALAAAKEAGL